MNELLQDLLHLDINKSTGTDNIGPMILNVSAPFIVSPLTYIFNRIIDSGIYPNILKNAKVSPIFKSGGKCLPTNYRPISVLPVISKLIEKHISRHMYQYLAKYNLLHDAQSGFRSNHSCQTALINIIDKWIEEMNNGNDNVVILLDLKKKKKKKKKKAFEFDVVDHDIMAKKFEIYGFNEKALTLFNSYMINITQQVQIGNALSDKCPVKYGVHVPQGSIFGPLLFILYINDLPLSISNCNTDMYADDSTIHISGGNISDIQTKVQEDLNRIELWCKDNNMFINCNKTKCITVGTKQKLAFQNEELYWTINSEQLQHSACEKLLGIKIDSNLNWKNQIDQVCSKISSKIYLSKIKKYLNLESMQLFYLGYILPLIDYCCVVWGNCSNEGLNRILKLQKKNSKINIRSRSHSTI